jgi:glyoxylate carboligase
MKSYKPQAEHEKVLVALKEWTSVKYGARSGKYDFEYAIEKLGTGFKARVTPLHINAEGKYLYIIDGEMCLNINGDLKIIESYQCAFPPFHLE